MVKKKEKADSSLKIVKDTLKYFFPIAWKFKKSYFFLFTIKQFFSIIQPFLAIFLMPLIIDELLGGQNITKIIVYAAILVIGEIVLNAITGVLQIQLEKYSDLFDNYFLEEMSLRVMGLDFQLTENKEALDQIEKAKEGMTWYSGGIHGLSTQFFDILSNVVKILGVIILMIINAPLLFIITSIILIIKSLVNKKLNILEISRYNKLSKVNRVFGYYLFEVTNFQYGKDIRLYGAEDMMVNKCNTQIDKMTANWKSSAEENLPLNMGTVFADVARDAATYFYLGFLVIMGKITIGTFSQMLTAGATFHSSMQGIIWGVQEIIKKSNYAYEYVKFMNYPPAMTSGDRQLTKINKHTIEFKNVSFTYPNTDVRVLDNVSIKINDGEHLSVVGLNGAGKTTFIKLMCRLYDVDSGKILLDGVDIKEYEYDEYMKIFSVVFQDFKLLSFSAKENVMLDDDQTDSKIDSLMKLVGLDDKMKSLPNGIHTTIFKEFDDDGIEMSGGEQQKLAIARALYKNSPVVILDEPTAALDPIAEYEIYRQFETLVGGKTAVYISHRLSSCKFCDRIAVFSEGTIKELGTHDQLVIIPNGIYAEMFEAQAQYYK